MAVGLDIGTMNLVAARLNESGDVVTKRMRDAFLELPMNSKKMLKMSQTSFIEKDKNLYVLGDAAFEIANVFGKEARRPLSGGLVASGELKALEILAVLIEQLLGEPQTPEEVCFYSIPAPPVDVSDRDVVYHKNIFHRILKDLGYTPVASNEAMAIVYAEAANEMFTAVSMSFGSGMTNVAMAVRTLEALTFSIQKGGDSIDLGAAQSVGSTQARICAIKESGIDLMDPKSREEEALSFYYQNHIEYVLDHFVEKFSEIKNTISLPEAVPLVVSGGTAKAQKFMELFEKTLQEKDFPFELSEIRLAKDPLTSVAQGLLVQAIQEEEGDEDG